MVEVQVSFFRAILFINRGGVDYMPLIEAVMRAGKRVYLGALNSGLSPRMRTAADRFLVLDAMYFDPLAAPTQSTGTQ